MHSAPICHGQDTHQITCLSYPLPPLVPHVAEQVILSLSKYRVFHSFNPQADGPYRAEMVNIVLLTPCTLSHLLQKPDLEAILDIRQICTCPGSNSVSGQDNGPQIAHP